MYFNGFGVEKDIYEAVKWYKNAAYFGSKSANVKLSNIDNK